MRKLLTKRGFTLIELLIVIAIIGILAAGVITLVNPVAQFQKARDAGRKNDLSQIKRALEAYYQDIGKYPPTTSTASLPNYSIIGLDGNPVSWGNSWTPYMSILPKDPSSPSKNYVYNAGADGQSYYLYASLDREANNLSNLPANASCGAGYVCNYGVSSPNVNP